MALKKLDWIATRDTCRRTKKVILVGLQNKLWGRYSYNQRNSGNAAYRTFKDKKC